jgi:lipopolysaccharide export system protein LptA
VIVLDRERRTLLASTTNASEPVRAVLVSAAGAEPPPGTGAKSGSGAGKEPGKGLGKEQGKASQPSVIRVRGGDLKYSDIERKAVMRSGVLGTVVAESATAASTSNELEVRLAPAGENPGRKDGQGPGQAAPGKAVQGQSQVESMTARGHVVLTSEGRRGTGEQLVYTSATGEYVLTGTAAKPPKMTDPARGTVSGEALIFQERDDSVRVEGGRQKTRTETTAPK